MSVEIDPEAAAFIARRGGCLYLWVDLENRPRAAESLPRTARLQEWNTEHMEGIEVSIGKSALELWRVHLRRLPWRRLEVLTN